MKILIVEDDKELCALLGKGLKKYDYTYDVAFDGEEALDYIDVNSYDAIILDINLPKVDVITVCKTARNNNVDTPIIMLTARTDTEDKVIGLDSGADDYLGKPFALSELSARLRALIRRNYKQTSNVIDIDRLHLNTENRVAKIDEKAVDLTSREYEILELLCFKYPNTVSTEEMIEHIWSSDANQFTNVTRVHITNLRRKLKAEYGEDVIETIKGRGYKVCLK